MASLSLLAAGLGAALLAGLVVGSRLLWVARRTRGLPELAIGLSSVLFPLGAIARLIARGAGALEPALYAGSMALLGLGAIASAVGLWRIFRPASDWPGVVCVILAGTQLAAGIETASGGLPPRGLPDTSVTLLVLSRIAVYLWAACECFRYSALLRRRLRLGLADPLIAHQILLWGVSAAAMTLLLGIMAAGRFATGVEGVFWPPAVIASCPLGVLAAAGIWLAFFPPRAYRRLVVGRAGRQTRAEPEDDR